MRWKTHAARRIIGVLALLGASVLGPVAARASGPAVSVPERTRS